MWLSICFFKLEFRNYVSSGQKCCLWIRAELCQPVFQFKLVLITCFHESWNYEFSILLLFFSWKCTLKWKSIQNRSKLTANFVGKKIEIRRFRIRENMWWARSRNVSNNSGYPTSTSTTHAGLFIKGYAQWKLVGFCSYCWSRRILVVLSAIKTRLFRSVSSTF